MSEVLRTVRVRGLGLALLAWAPALASSPAAAQPPPAQPGSAPSATPLGPPADPAAQARWDEAAKLFAEGRAAMSRPGQLERACETLARSYAMQARGDTLLNLAECHRRQGKTATAWREFDEAIRYAMEAEFAEAIATAVLRRDDLAKTLSVLVVEVDAAALPADLAVVLDGKKLPPAQWNQPLYVDPGPHAVAATATGYEPFEATAEVPPKGARAVLSVAPKKLPPPPTVTPPPVTPPPKVAEKAAPREAPVWPYVAGGLGLAAIGTSVVFGIDSMIVGGELDQQCGDERKACPPTYDFESDRGQELRSFGFYLGLGIAGLAATTAGVLGLVLADGGASGEVAVSPWATPEGAGVSVRGVTF